MKSPSRWQRVATFMFRVLAGLIAALGTASVALAGFVLSFVAIRDVAVWSHISPRWAWMLPVAVDGAMAVASVTAVVLHRLRRSTVYPWIVVLTGASISIGCNATHAWAAGGDIALPRATAMLVSALPPILLAMSIHLLVVLVDAASRHVATSHAQPDATDVNATPQVESQAIQPPADADNDQGDDAEPDGNNDDWPVDLIRRIPVNQAQYEQWQRAWHDLQTGADLQEIADRHGYNLRTIQFIRRAGERRLLEFDINPVRNFIETRNGNGSATAS